VRRELLWDNQKLFFTLFDCACIEVNMVAKFTEKIHPEQTVGLSTLDNADIYIVFPVCPTAT